MPSPSPYAPDRSLVQAVVVLLVALLFGAGGWYVLASLPADLAPGHGARIAQSHSTYAPRRSRAPAASVPRRRSRRPIAPSSPAFGRLGSGVPDKAGNGGRDGSSQNPSQSRYELSPDFGHARLGPVPQGGGAAGSSSGSADASPDRSFSGGASGSVVADVRGSSGSVGKTGSDLGPAIAQLGGQLRALEGAIADLDRSEKEEDPSSSLETRREGTRTSSATQASDRDVPNPPSVPVDDHLHWLLGAGLLWGVWRFWHGC